MKYIIFNVWSKKYVQFYSNTAKYLVWTELITEARQFNDEKVAIEFVRNYCNAHNVGIRPLEESKTICTKCKKEIKDGQLVLDGKTHAIQKDCE